jgi:hypothetical protein
MTAYVPRWEYDPTDRTSGAPEAIWESGQVIARVEDVGGPTRANGRLIAAAPELLEACKAYLFASQEGGISHADYFEVARRKIEAAIAKAEGK